MSFLLLKSRSGRPAPSTKSKRPNPSIAFPRNNHGTRNRFSLPARASNQGDQIQLHRPLHKRSQQQHLSRQRSRQKEPSQTSQQTTKSQDDIVSMDEGKKCAA